MAPGAEELPFIVTVPDVQVMVPVVDAPAEGTAVLLVTEARAVLVHPLPGSVTVKV